MIKTAVTTMVIHGITTQLIASVTQVSLVANLMTGQTMIIVNVTPRPTPTIVVPPVPTLVKIARVVLLVIPPAVTH